MSEYHNKQFHQKLYPTTQLKEDQNREILNKMTNRRFDPRNTMIN